MKVIKHILVDKLALLLIAVNIILLLICVLYVLLNINGLDQTAIVSFRNHPLLSGGETLSSSPTQLYQLALTPMLSSLAAGLLCMQFYRMDRRSIAIMILSMNALVLLFAFIVANSLFTLNS